MTARVFVTGIGLMTAIGDTAAENLKSIHDGATGLTRIAHIETINRDRFPVCEIRHGNRDLSSMAGLESGQEISRTALLGLVAAGEALSNAGLASSGDIDCGIVSANSVGGMDRSELFYPDFLENNQSGRLRAVKGHECAFSTDFIGDRLRLRGFRTTISTACSSSANAVMLGARLIRHGRCDRILAGGCDALTRFTINGFASLKILDTEGCKPFDENRSGLNLGEGAAFLVLESEQVINLRKNPPIAEVTGYANTCDAYHQTASSPDGEGAYQAMKQALDTAGLAPEQIDYINAHGTGTANNDLSEGRAIERLFDNSPPYFSSTKPFTGHTLGAAGAIEAVYLSLIHI